MRSRLQHYGIHYGDPMHPGCNTMHPSARVRAVRGRTLTLPLPLGAVSIEERAEEHGTTGSDSHGDSAPWAVDAAAHVAAKGAVFMVSPDTSLRLEARGGS